MIIIDIDGVVCDSEPLYREILHGMTGVNLDRPQRTYGFTDHFTRGQTLDMLEIFYKYRILEPCPIPAAELYVSALHHDRVEIHFVTARPEKTKEVTAEWLLKWKFPYRRLVHTWNKLKYAQDNNAKLIIEDKATTANLFAQAGIPAILYTHNWNKPENCDYPIHPSIIRVHSWAETYNKIKEIV